MARPPSPGRTPLLTSSLIVHAAQHHGDTEIVSRSVEGPIHRYSYAEAHGRAQRLAKALCEKTLESLEVRSWQEY